MSTSSLWMSFVAWLGRGAKRVAKNAGYLRHGSKNSAAYIAALSLVAIQVGIGIVMKASQTSGGKYAFSPSASVAISEFLKMLISTSFFYRECKARILDRIPPATRANGGDYDALDLPMTENQHVEKADDQDCDPIDEHEYLQADELRDKPDMPQSLNVTTFWRYIRGEVTADVRYGFCNLAMFYVLINNSIFVSYRMADPGTINLTKAGVTFITALVMIVTLGTAISKTQWMAIIMQICGLGVTQYNPETGTTYPITTYLILLVQVFLSASSGVYNQALLKTDNSSLHANNMILYAAGSITNIIVHITLTLIKEDEPGFFIGYGSFGAIMVIMSNVLIGLAITAVYKYADAIIKCFATALSTGILLYLTPLLFATKMSFLVVPGTIVVFVASYLYIENPVPKTNIVQLSGKKVNGNIARFVQRYRRMVLLSSTILTVISVAWLALFLETMPYHPERGTFNPYRPDSNGSDRVGNDTSPQSSLINPHIIESPFRNTVAMVRWNSPYPERVPYIQKYEPFFHAVHMSLPESSPDVDVHNLTHDAWPANGTFTVYVQIARTMQLLLDTEPEVDGLMYYHFDAWIDPLGFVGMDKERIWYPKQQKPIYQCMNDTKIFQWWGWDKGFHRAILEGQRLLLEDFAQLGYKATLNEFCVGWSDIYFIPRKYFADYILLTAVFGERLRAFHEMAIPTMLTIIDRTYRSSVHNSVIDVLGSCWGHCCAEGPRVYDILSYPCGHKMDYREEEVVNAFFSKLGEQEKMVTRPATDRMTIQTLRGPDRWGVEAKGSDKEEQESTQEAEKESNDSDGKKTGDVDAK